MTDPRTSLHVEALGPMQVRRGPVPVDLGPTKQRAVFACLALDAGEAVSVDTLLEAVWGESAPNSARKLVHTYVARLRQALEPEMPPRNRIHMIESASSAYRLVVDSGHIDVVRFRHLVAQAQGQRTAGEWYRAFDLLGEAVRLWRDPALNELSGLLHVPYRIDALRRTWVDAALEYVSLGVEHGMASTVLPTAQRLAGAEPLHEEIQARYLAVLEQTGQRSAAIERFAELRATLSGELGIDPGPELAAAYRQVLAGTERPAAERRPAPVGDAGRSPWRGTHPVLDALVPRRRELDSLVRALSRQRVVTLTGPPGCGKSTLALQAAAQVRDTFSGGVIVADLTEARDRQQLVGPVLELLEAAADDRDVTAVLAEKETLVILDNIELVVEPCASFVDRLLRTCEYVSVIVTSREPLGLPYESVWRVRPLAPPEQGAARPEENAAVELFARRAAQVRPGFRVGPDNVDAVATICRRLDGLPLALELAAACLSTDSLEAVVRKLDDPLGQIRPARRGMPVHQRSLYAALYRSVECLTAAERWILARLGALDRCFDLPDIRDACGRMPWDDVDPAAVLARLADKSLLSVHHGRSGCTYRTLWVVHRFAAAMRDAERADLRGIPGGGHQAVTGSLRRPAA